ncbi:MAG: 30S ribosomal protein S14 [Thermoanaerobaculia bacterium]|nr:30S ribosomal protein S14 [Thermoanaerobaculia bacterium]
MASKAKIAKNEKRKRMAERYREQRLELKKIINDKSRSMEDRMEAQYALRQLPRDASPTRVVNRCNLTGRPRGYYRKFGLSRIALRDLALQGYLPGVIKASW